MAANGSNGESAGVFERLAPIRADYAVAPIDDSFNWSESLAAVSEGEWYLVAFRSVRKTTADDRLLEERDELAYQEAVAGAGLAHYFRGDLDEERRCISFCVWQDRPRAEQSARSPRHVEAIELAGDTYTSYVLERYRLTKRDGRVTIEQIEPPQLSAAVSSD